MSSSDSEEDVHQCGRCKEIFKNIDEYFKHKKSKACRKIKAQKIGSSEKTLPKATRDDEEEEDAQDPPSQSDFLASVDLGLSESVEKEKPDAPPTRQTRRRRAATRKKIWFDDDAEIDDEDKDADFIVKKAQKEPVLRVRGRARSRGRGRGRGRGRAAAVVVEENKPPESAPQRGLVRRRGVKTRGGKLNPPPAPVTESVLEKPEDSGPPEDKTNQDIYLPGVKGRAARGRAAARALVAAKLREIEGDDGIDIDLGISHKYATTLTAKQLAQRKEAVMLRSNKFFQCPECSYRAKHQDEYDRHLRTVHNLSTYVCPSCLLPFRDKYKLKRHLESKRCKGKTMHTDVPKYMKFTSSSRIFKKNLESEILKDSDDDDDIEPRTKIPRGNFLYNYGVTHPFQCNECEKTFSSYDQIISHLEQHPDIFPGICRFCGRWFPSRYKLWRHMTSSIHDDVDESVMIEAKAEIQKLKINWPAEAKKKSAAFTKYECKRCNITFSTKVTLLNHMKELHVPVTVTKRFRCDHCTNNFGKRAGLIKHMKEDHGIDDPCALSQFKCPVCSRIFKQKSHVLRHRESLHTPVQQVPWEDTDDEEDDDEKSGSEQENDASDAEDSGKTNDDSDLKTADKGSQLNNEAQKAKQQTKIIDSIAHGKGEAENENDEQEDDDDDDDDEEDDDDDEIGTDEEQSSDEEKDKPKKKKFVVHSCFVCYKIAENRGKLCQHIDTHRIWTTNPNEKPYPHDIFENPPRIPNDRDRGSFQLFVSPWEKSQQNNDQVAQAVIAGQMRTQVADGSSPTKGDQQVLTSLTTIDQAAFSSLMQEQAANEAAAAQMEGLQTIKLPGNLLQSATSTIVINAGNQQQQVTFIAQPLPQPPEASTVVPQDKSPQPSKSIDDISPCRGPPKDGKGGASSEYLCPYCLTLKGTLQEMYEHKTKFHKLRAVFRCLDPDCCKIFLNMKDYEEHDQIHPQKAFICNICNDHFPDTTALIGHKSARHRNIHSAGGNVCKVCSKSFASKEALKAHTTKDLHHHQCHQCGVILKSPTDLREHQAAHKGVKSFLCEQCGTTFVSKLALKRHIMTHNPTKSHACDLCDAAFNKKEHLRRHKVAKHSTAKPFVCKQPGCEKAFSRKDKLQEHLKAHSTEKPYICQQCGRRYRYREGLRYHEKTHERTTKYTCSICNVPFPRPGQLRTHLKSVHGIATKEQHLYPCPQCSALFSRPERVKRHMEREHGVSALWKVYCTLCNRGFPGEKSLDSHTKTRHAPGPDGQPLKAKRVVRKAQRKGVEDKDMSGAPEQDLLAAVMDQSLQQSVPVVPPGSTVTTQPTDTQYNSATIVVNIVHDNNQPVRSDAVSHHNTPVAMMTHHHQPVTVIQAQPHVSEPEHHPGLPLAPVPLQPGPAMQERGTPYIHTEGLSVVPPNVVAGPGNSMVSSHQMVTQDRHVLQTLMPAPFIPEKSHGGLMSTRAGEMTANVTSTLLPATGAFQPVTSDRSSLGPPPLNPTPLMPTALTPGPMPPNPLTPSPMVPGVGHERATPTGLTPGHEMTSPLVVLSSVPVSHTNTVQYVPATFSTYVNYDARY